MNKNTSQRAGIEPSMDASIEVKINTSVDVSRSTSMDSVLSQYVFNEQSSSQELIEFTLKSLRDLLPVAGFKIIKSRKAIEMKTREFMISIYLQANRHNTAGTSIEVMVHCKVTHNKRKAHTGLPESYYQHSELKWYELVGKDAFKESFISMTEYIIQHELPLIEQLLSDPQRVIEEHLRYEEDEKHEDQEKHEDYEKHAELQQRVFSPYFYYRYGTEAQFEQARQRYVGSLSEAQNKQYDEAVTKFQADRNSPIKRGEDWACLTVAKASGYEI